MSQTTKCPFYPATYRGCYFLIIHRLLKNDEIEELIVILEDLQKVTKIRSKVLFSLITNLKNIT